MRVTQERVARFRRFGGVDLARLDPEERDPLLTLVHVGMAHLKKATFSFRCEMCGSVVTTDNELSPACTGPSWTNEHPLEPMTPIRG